VWRGTNTGGSTVQGRQREELRAQARLASKPLSPQCTADPPRAGRGEGGRKDHDCPSPWQVAGTYLASLLSDSDRDSRTPRPSSY
jgi:hypothetical protein